MVRVSLKSRNKFKNLILVAYNKGANVTNVNRADKGRSTLTPNNGYHKAVTVAPTILVEWE